MLNDTQNVAHIQHNLPIVRCKQGKCRGTLLLPQHC